MLVEKVQIAGGGVAGLAAGPALRDRGVEVEIQRSSTSCRGGATSFSIWAYAIKRLMELGFDRERLDSVGREIVESHVVDDQDRPLMTLPAQKASAEVGAPSMDVDRRRLQEAMIEMIEMIGSDRYRFGSEVTGVEETEDRVALVLADGTRAEGDLVLDGDGIHSVIRDRVLEQSVDLKRSRYQVIEGIAPFDERVLPRGHNKQVWGSKARCGVGWVGEENVRWFLGGRGIALAGDPPLSKPDLLARVEGMPEIVSAMLDATDEGQIVRTEVRHGYPPKRWHSGRTVLLGDAAHTLSPFAGMGACSTIEDVGHLVRLLDESPSLEEAWPHSSASARATWRRSRRGRRNEQLMMPSNALFYWARNEVLGHTPDEKLLEIAEGMAGDES